MKNFIVKMHEESCFYPITDELMEHIECIKKNVQPAKCCIGGYLPISDKTTFKRRKILCDVIDAMAMTNTGRQILTMIPQEIQIYALSKRNKEEGDNFGESYALEQCIVLNPNQLYVDMKVECVDTLAHEMAHIIHYNLKRKVLKSSYGKLNPYDEFCLSFFDEISAHICGEKTALEYIGQPNKPISIADIVTSKMYWHWHYGDMLHQLTDYQRPLRQAKNVHTPSYYKLWRAYFEMHPELKWPGLVRYIQRGGATMMRIIHSDMVRHKIEPHGKKLVDRYYPLLRHLRVHMSRLKE